MNYNYYTRRIDICEIACIKERLTRSWLPRRQDDEAHVSSRRAIRGDTVIVDIIVLTTL